MTDAIALPSAFADLGDLAAQWGRPTENLRSHTRWNATADDFAAFYGAMIPRLDAILTHLGRLQLDEMSDEDTNLFCLAAAFAEAAPHHELYKGSPDVPFSFSARRFVPGHGDIPSWT